jgi:hypothetical protein
MHSGVNIHSLAHAVKLFPGQLLGFTQIVLRKAGYEAISAKRLTNGYISLIFAFTLLSPAAHRTSTCARDESPRIFNIPWIRLVCHVIARSQDITHNVVLCFRAARHLIQTRHVPDIQRWLAIAVPLDAETSPAPSGHTANRPAEGSSQASAPLPTTEVGGLQVDLLELQQGFLGFLECIAASEELAKELDAREAARQAESAVPPAPSEVCLYTSHPTATSTPSTTAELSVETRGALGHRVR